MAEPDVRRFLAALAGHDGTERTAERPAGDGTYRERIDEAVAATTSLEDAAAYLSTNDLDDLVEAVEYAESDLSARASDGANALETLRRLQSAADGTSQFQSGRSSPLGGEDVAGTR